MARSLERTFSFDDNDETSLRGGSPTNHHTTTRSPPPYTDSPTRRDRNSPPPTPRHHHYPASSYRLSHINTRQEPLGHSTSIRTASTTTPGADNLGESAVGGGIAGVALGIANTHQRESGMAAMREAEAYQNPRNLPPERGFDTVGSDTPYIPEPPPSSHRVSQGRDPFASPAPSKRSNPFDDGRGSPTPTPGQLTPGGYPSTTSIPMNDYPPQDAFAHSRSYSDNPYNRYSSAWDPRVSRADIDPNEIDDEGDDMMGPPAPRRRSMLGLNDPSQARSAAAGGAAAGGVLGALGGLVGRRVSSGPSARDASGQYGPVGAAPVDEGGAEKSEWLNSQTSGRKRLRWIVGLLLALALIGGIVGGVIGGLKHAKSDSSNSSPGQSASEDKKSNGDLDKDSPDIQKLLNNPDLHKIFPGVDYTPFNGQYPECLTNPPTQNNVTRDVAVLSQLTNTIRLYGTDCNQTEMVLHAISKLDLPNIKVWLGVWLDRNQTTNDRGMSAMWELLDKNGPKPFAGVIIGNEAIYREDLTLDQLGKILEDTKKNFTDQKIDLPVATSDLGNDWTAALASKVDVIMSNVHPFFAGEPVDTASGWTWSFWQDHDVKLTAGTAQKHVVSEVGWPSGGGTRCPETLQSCPGQGSVAGIEEMNKFMDTYICQSLSNGTDFFWFEAFDEPWKVAKNEPGKEWEDKWGLMDPGRKLKPGLKIPDCGGKTVD